MRILSAALMLIALSACSDLQVKTEQDWDTDFARYRTYAWGEGVPARDPSIESQIHAAVDFELPFKGLKPVATAASPDLYVATYASVEEERVVDQWGYDVSTAGASSHFNALTLPIGTLVIDLVDARSDKLVWRGQASKAVDRQISEATLRKVVRDIFRRYPQRG
jgi:uncharacterized protein DUF4136